MSEHKLAVYDPDPTQHELETFAGIDVDIQDIEAFATVQGVKILVHLRRGTLLQLKASQESNNKLQEKYDVIRNEREDLRVQIARLKSQVNSSWLEIPISIMTGFGINLLTSSAGDNATSEKTIGWFLLVIGALMLLCLRSEQIFGLFNRKGEDKTDG